MSLIEIIGATAGMSTVLVYVPQAIKTLRTQHTKDLSLPMYIISVSSALLWVVYGLVKGIPAIWAANGTVFILALTILIVKLRRG